MHPFDLDDHALLNAAVVVNSRSTVAQQGLASPALFHAAEKRGPAAQAFGRDQPQAAHATISAGMAG
jgi:hypothetical protein